MTKHYTISGLHVARDGEIWSLPALVGDGSLATGHIAIRIAEDGVACNPMTDGAGADQQKTNIYKIEVGERVLGWGDFDCDHSYRVAGGVVPAAVLGKVAEWTGLKLPVASA